MSDRAIVNDKDKMAAWMRSMEDRVNALQQRKLQGDLAIGSTSIAEASIDSLTVGALAGTMAMPATAPIKLKGSAGWTQDIEQVGNPAAVGANAANTHALVTRDANGAVVDIWPRPWIQVTQSAALSVATGVRGVVAAANQSLSYSAPYTFDQTYDSTQGAIVIPVTGFWQFFVFGTWSAVNDATLRACIPQISQNGGGTWGDHFQDNKASAAGAADTSTHLFTFEQGYQAGWMFRLNVIHRSATTPLNYTATRFSAVFQRGFT